MRREYIISGQERIALTIYEKDRQNPVIIFVHGTGFYGVYFNEFLSALKELGYTVISVDLKGHGDSDGTRGDFSVPEIMQNLADVVAFVRTRYNGRIGFIGTSQGGIFGLHAAARDLGIKSYICHCSAILTEPESEAVVLPRALLLKKAILFTRHFVPYHCWLARHIKVKIWVYLNKKGLFQDDAYLAMLENDDVFVEHYSLRALHSLLTESLSKNIENITVPIMFLHSEEDRVFPLEYMQSLYERLTTHKTIIVLPQASHMVMAENPALCLPAIEKWFKETL